MKKASLLVIFLTVFLDLVGFGIVIPLLPRYTELFGAQGVQIGVIVASYSVMQFIFASLWGRLSDRIGRRPVLLISLAGSAVSYGLFGAAAQFSGATGLWLLVASRVFGGLCGANLGVASAYIADITPPEKRSKGMGLIGAAFGLGFILGPAIGAFSARMLGLPGPGWIAAGLCAANFVLACFILGESRQPGSAPARVRPRLQQWIHSLSQPRMGLLLTLVFLGNFCFACFETILPLFLGARFGYDETQLGYLFTYCGVVTAFVQGGAIGRLVRRFGEPALVFVSFFGIALSLVVVARASHLGTLLVGLGLFALTSGINRAPLMGLISLNSAAAEQGATLGVSQSASTLARIFGPIIATALYHRHPGLPYLACAGLALLTGGIAWARLCVRSASFTTGNTRPEPQPAGSAGQDIP